MTAGRSGQLLGSWITGRGTYLSVLRRPDGGSFYKVDAPHHIYVVRGTVAGGPVSRILFLLAQAAIIPLDAASPRHSSDLPAGLARRASTQFPAYLVLLRVGFALPSPLLTTRCALTAPFHPYPIARAVSSLWHFPSSGFDAAVPGVIRHAALRSSDFPPPPAQPGQDRRKRAGSDRPAQQLTS